MKDSCDALWERDTRKETYRKLATAALQAIANAGEDALPLARQIAEACGCVVVPREVVKELKPVKTLLPLLRTITVKQAITSGEDVIDACGLNPWCMNEGLADGHEQALANWRIDEVDKVITAMIAAAEGEG